MNVTSHRLRSSRRWRSRRGAAVPFVLAAAAVLYTSVSLVSDTYSAGHAQMFLMALRAHSDDFVQIQSDILTQRRDRGDISHAECEAAIEELHRNRPLFDEVLQQLIERQEQMRDVAGGRWAIGVGTTVVGAYLPQEPIYLLESAWLTTASNYHSWVNSHVLSEQEFLDAFQAAAERMQRVDRVQHSRDAVRLRVHQWFDLWHARNVEGLPPGQFERNRRAYRDSCHAAFQECLQRLQGEGWTVEPEGLDAFATEALKAYSFYVKTFRPGIDGSYFVYRQDPATGQFGPVTFALEEQASRLVLKCSRIDDDHYEFVLSLVPPFPEDDLQAFAAFGLRIPQTVRVVGERQESPDRVYYFNRGPEAKQVVATAAKMGALVGAALGNLFSGQMPRIDVTVHDAVLIVTPDLRDDAGNVLIQARVDVEVRTGAEAHRDKSTQNLLAKPIR